MQAIENSDYYCTALIFSTSDTGEALVDKHKEITVVGIMVDMYYKKHPHQDIDKNTLMQYIQLRRNKCPHGDNKPFCNVCTIHCYKPDMRAQVRAVMKYAGPRLLLSHPILAIQHLASTLRAKRRK